MAKPFKAHDAAAISKALKRPLRPHEIASGKIDEANATPFDDELIRAEKRLADKNEMAMSPEEREVQSLKRARQAALDAKTDDAALAVHQAKVAPRLAELKKLQAVAVNDPAYNAFDRATIEKAVSYLEFGSSEPSMNDYQKPSIGDPQVAEAYWSEVNEIVTTKNAAKSETLRTKQVELAGQLLNIEAELATLGGKPANQNAISPADVKNAWDKFAAAQKQHGPDSDEAKAAHGEWGTAFDGLPIEQMDEYQAL